MNIFKRHAYKISVPIGFGPVGRGTGGHVGADPSERHCTSDLLDDSVWTSLDLGGAPATSVVDRQEISFRARTILSKTPLMNPTISAALSCTPCLRQSMVLAASLWIS